MTENVRQKVADLYLNRWCLYNPLRGRQKITDTHSTATRTPTASNNILLMLFMIFAFGYYKGMLTGEGHAYT